MYGKIIDGKLEVARKVVKLNEQVIFNPSEEILKELGYKPVYIEPVNVESGYGVEPYWEEEKENIVQKWIIKPFLRDSDVPVWDVWQGKRFEVGDECIVEGRVFRSKVSHAAAWNKRPLTGIDWEDYFEEVK